MDYLKQEFSLSYEFKKGCIVRSVAGGTLQNGVSYSSSVKITARNVFEVFNQKTNFNDTKEIALTMKFNCDNDYDAGSLALALKEYFKTHDVLRVTGSLANLQNNEYVTTCDINYDDLLKLIDPKNKAKAV